MQTNKKSYPLSSADVKRSCLLTDTLIYTHVSFGLFHQSNSIFERDPKVLSGCVLLFSLPGRSWLYTDYGALWDGWQLAC